MRTALLANNHLGAQVGTYLAERGELVALVVHPREGQKHGEELAQLDVPTYVWPDGLAEIRQLMPECILSVLFGYKLGPEWLGLPTWKPVNLHPALLPFNRGSAPNVWPLVDGSPAGVTLHVMDASIDTGPILCQREVEVRDNDTAATLYERLAATSLELFREAWPTIRDCTPTPQPEHGTFHRLADLASLDPVSASDLAMIDRLRARTYPPFGAEFERSGQRYRIVVDIQEID